MNLELFPPPPPSPLLVVEHPLDSYRERTLLNVASAPVTVAFAADFTTAGELLTARAAGLNFCRVSLIEDSVEQAIKKLVAAHRGRKGMALNVAGNGLQTLSKHGISQDQVDSFVFEVLSEAYKLCYFSLIRSGGQTGADTSGLLSAIVLGIPAVGLYPKNFRRRDATGRDFYATAKEIEEELWQLAAQLKAKAIGRRTP